MTATETVLDSGALARKFIDLLPVEERDAAILRLLRTNMTDALARFTKFRDEAPIDSNEWAALDTAVGLIAMWRTVIGEAQS